MVVAWTGRQVSVTSCLVLVVEPGRSACSCAPDGHVAARDRGTEGHLPEVGKSSRDVNCAQPVRPWRVRCPW
ncbi:hypothetical protein QBC39DRAFT_347028 [Podospora conica]|nr:hypothetical protein QBC39DRAFT_347028 [Schizothecium conicum]